MDFAVMGTISSYVKRKNLTFAAKHKIRTGQTLVNSNGNFISLNTSTFDKMREAAKASATQAKTQKLSRIKRKLRDGQKLSDEELGFLRVNDPKTYKKAKAADDAREELKAELKKAKSKSEAREAMTRAMLKASSGAMAELGAFGQSGGTSQAGGSVNAASASVSVGGDAGAMNLGGEVSASADVNVAGADSPTPTDVNQAVQSNELGATDSANRDEKNFAQPAQKNSDADKFSREDVLEKYLWTIRALEDEWARFTNSDEYKDLPDHLADEIVADKKIRRLVSKPDRRLLNAASAYRRVMNLTNKLA